MVEYPTVVHQGTPKGGRDHYLSNPTMWGQVVFFQVGYCLEETKYFDRSDEMSFNLGFFPGFGPIVV
jgi:hypothetical protein